MWTASAAPLSLRVSFSPPSSFSVFLRVCVFLFLSLSPLVFLSFLSTRGQRVPIGILFASWVQEGDLRVDSDLENVYRPAAKVGVRLRIDIDPALDPASAHEQDRDRSIATRKFDSIPGWAAVTLDVGEQT